MQYDVVIVGGGSAGCVMANRLSEDPKRSVILLEAGTDYPDFTQLPDDLKFGNNDSIASSVGAPHNWSFTGIANTFQDSLMQVPRGMVMGGSSSINTQSFPRGDPDDYDDWAALGNDEWAFERVLPYFRRIERDLDFSGDFHGTEGPIPVRRHKPSELTAFQAAFTQACIDAKFPYVEDKNHPGVTGIGPMPTNNINGIRMSTAITHLDPARHRLNLTVRSKCFVTKVHFRNRRAVGVEVESGGEKFDIYGNEIILCGGAIQSPQLLLLSGVGPAAQLREVGIPAIHDLPGVGLNLRDHPTVSILYKTSDLYQLNYDVQRTQVALNCSAEGFDIRNDIEVWANSFATLPGGDPTVAVGVSNSCVLVQAMGSGNLKLTSSDPHVQPELNYRFLEDNRDLERLRWAVRMCVGLSTNPTYRDIIVDRITPSDVDLATDKSLNLWLLNNVRSMAHISGTCKMGPIADDMAVVDQYCNVRGLEGIRVVDASVMPNIIRATTNPTVIMMADRVSEWVK